MDTDRQEYLRGRLDAERGRVGRPRPDRLAAIGRAVEAASKVVEAVRAGEDEAVIAKLRAASKAAEASVE